MHTLGSKNSRPIRLFHEMFGAHLATDDYMEFYSNRRKAGTDTFLSLDIYKADKLATIVLEEYAVKGKLRGHVMVVFPEPRYDVPIFMFQLGGNERQSIALLDISPVRQDLDYGPVLRTFDKYRDLMAMQPSQVEWVTSISSPYLLHCQYGDLDEEVFMAAAREYLGIWIEHYYRPGRLLDDPDMIAQATSAILRYKHILHANDPAYGIFSRAWGKKVADAFMYLETRDHPALDLQG